jgi:hypothetical protein
MSKTVPLNNSTAVVKSAEKLPAPTPQRQYGDFDEFATNLDKLDSFYQRISHYEDRLCAVNFEWVKYEDYHVLDLDKAKQHIQSAKSCVEIAQGPLLKKEFEWARKLMAACKRDVKWFDRRELYDIKGKGKRKREKWTLSRRVVAEEIALLLASFPNARPGTPEAFGKMMIEEVYAKSPNACVLESACRQVRREKDFPPSIAEVLKAIKNESSVWCDCWETLEWNIDCTRQSLEKLVAEASAKIAEAEAKFAEREAKARAEEEQHRLYREAYKRIPESERKAFEDGQRHRRFQNRPETPEEYCEFDHLREFHAYHAGLAGEQIPGLELKTNGAAGGT